MSDGLQHYNRQQYGAATRHCALVTKGVLPVAHHLGHHQCCYTSSAGSEGVIMLGGPITRIVL